MRTGDNATAIVTLSNMGDAAVSISELSSNHSIFTLDTVAPLSILPVPQRCASHCGTAASGYREWTPAHCEQRRQSGTIDIPMSVTGAVLPGLTHTPASIMNRSMRTSKRLFR